MFSCIGTVTVLKFTLSSRQHTINIPNFYVLENKDDIPLLCNNSGHVAHVCLSSGSIIWQKGGDTDCSVTGKAAVYFLEINRSLPLAL